MQEDWWERPVCYICDYWWAFLLALVLILTGWFTRDYWMPAAPLPSATLPAATPTRVATLGTGDVQVTLIWNSTNDLDLWVVDPQGEKIYFGQKTAPSGGMLDVDANAGCGTVTTQPVENIFWPSGEAPQGGYALSVNFFRQCDAIAATPFTLRALVDGQIQEFTGILNAVNETIEVYRFER
jgi:hypothetical protein